MAVKKFKNEQEFREWNQAAIDYLDPEKYYENPPLVVRIIEGSRVKTILKMLKIEDGITVLDAGCGPCTVLARIRSVPCIGVDISDPLLAKSRKRLKQGDSLICSNLEKLSLKNACADRVICSEVLEHVSNPETLIAELARVSKPEAYLVLTIPNEKLIRRLKRMAKLFMPSLFKGSPKESHDKYEMPDEMTDLWHLHEFTPAQIRGILEQYFDIERIAGIPSRFLPIRYIFRVKKR